MATEPEKLGVWNMRGGQQTGKDDPWYLYGYLDRNGRYYMGLSSNYEDAGEIALTVEQALELANLLVEEAKTGLREQAQAKGDWEAEFRHPLNGLVVDPPFHPGVGKTAYINRVQAERVTCPVCGREYDLCDAQHVMTYGCEECRYGQEDQTQVGGMEIAPPLANRFVEIKWEEAGFDEVDWL